MKWLEKIIAEINPRAAAKRASARIVLEQMRNYEAANKNRRTSHWKSSMNSADADIIPSLSQLRNNSRNMVRNNSYAFKAIGSLVTNLVGSGIRPNPTSQNNEKQLDLVKTYWKKWAGNKDCDFLSNMNFYGLQSLATRSMLESGECLILRRRLKSIDKGVLPIKLQVLEPDFLDSFKTTLNTGKGTYINHGIEYNADGQRVAYWLFKNHPGNQFNYYSISERVPAEDVIHLYRILRPGQERGVPAGVSAFLRLNDFDDYEDAELVRQKISACWVAFISGGTEGLPETTDEEAPQPREKMAPGIIERLDPGKTVTVASPPTTTGQAEYGHRVLLGGAAGYETTYEAMTGDLSQTNFSSGRLGGLELVRTLTEIQNNTIIAKYCEGVWTWFMEALYLKEGIKSEKISVDWTAPRREMIDMEKETQAIENQILAGLTSWSEAARGEGFIPEDLLKEIASDQAKFKELGIKLSSDANNLMAPKPNAANASAQAGN